MAIHILSNISQSKDNQTMKFGGNRIWRQKYFSLKIMQKLKQVRLDPDLFLFFKKT